MLTLGIDPGTAATGYGLVDQCGETLNYLNCGCILTSAKENLQTRLGLIYNKLQALIAATKPAAIAIEKLYFGQNTKTAMAVGQARGVILLAAAESGVKTAEYTPLEVKMALTGYGRADKKQMQQMVKILLGLKEIPRPDDAADALAVAICHLNSYKMASL